MEITQKQAMEKYLSDVVSTKTAHELASIEGEALTEVYNSLYEQMAHEGLLPKEPTVRGVLQGLSDLVQINFIKSDMTITEYQDILFQQVDLLSSILGIELEG
ncbi:hypothetical protein E0L10_06150 [Enterococcus durans]|uniref:hypothetical protein n=1 Tax=Enterococcus durans TaxID=53345 RepID=UPI001431D5AB|nr:hypothetical protein [Enterococcus durans]NJE63737.1 hypothetical protein [Enterococcus durans]